MKKNLHIKEAEMQRRMYEVSILKELGERIGYSLNVQKIVDVITGSLRKLLPYSTVSYLLLGEEGKVIFHCIMEESVNKKFVSDVESRMIEALVALTNNKIKADEIDESITGTITDESSKEAIKSFFNVPVIINDQPMGILNVASTKSGLYKEDEITILYTIMNQASTAVSKLENILNQEKGKLNSMIKSMADGVFMVDNRNRLIVINPAAIQMLGIGNPNPTIFDVLDVLASRFDLRTRIEESIKTDKLTVEENLKLNNKVLRILISPVKDNENEPLGAVVLFQDVTKEKAIEKMREDFTSMMVHELRSPLTGIRSIANLLKEDKIKNEQKKYQEFIELIVSNSSSMLGLVNDLLDVAKLEAGKLQIVKKDTDIKKIIDLHVEMYQPQAKEKSLTLEANIIGELPIIQVDENKVGQVLNNLLSNAIKFTQKGKIVINAFVGKQGEDLMKKVTSVGMIWPGIKAENTLAADSLVVGVTDTGMGIKEEEVNKLFNKFTQLEQSAASEKKGTGLGLVISKGIVEAHAGKIGVFSKAGEGSTFYFIIPIKTDDQAIAKS